MSGWKEERLDKGTARQSGDFLFKFPDSEDETDKLLVSLGLQARTRISNQYLLSSLLMYSTIYQVFEADYARIIHDNLARYMISEKGKGRSEAVEVLSGGLPDEKIINRGQA